MSDETTAVARHADADLPEVARGEIQSLRQAGAVAVARQKALNDTTRQLAGMKWGDVSGQSLSAHTRYAIAQLCDLTGANPALHLFILGGRPYLNADYWAQTVAQNPHSLGFEQVNIAKAAADEYRAQARQLVKDAAELDMPELKDDARDLMRKAAYCDEKRAQYGVDDKTIAAYETVIRRYAEHAPLAAIRTGQVDGSAFVVEIRECNVAGSGRRGDPVGDARPHETARSRSLRRCAVRAYATTLQPFEEQLRKLENAIEAEFEVIGEERMVERAALSSEIGEQVVRIGAGEPEAAAPVDAEPLPVEETAAPRANARKERDKFRDGCRIFGIDNIEAFVRDTLGHDAESLEDYQALNRALAALADGEAVSSGQGQLI